MGFSPRPPWERIKEAMRDKGLNPTQVECARLIGVRQPSISEWAAQKTAPSVENAIRLARKLNVCVEWILTGNGPKRPGPPMDPLAQRVWDAWSQIPEEERPIVVGYVEGKIRPFHPGAEKRARSTPAR